MSPVPEPIEPIHFSEPRAVQVREPGNLASKHSTVMGTMHVYVDTKAEADAIIAAWREIMNAAAEYAQAILDDIRNPGE